MKWPRTQAITAASTEIVGGLLLLVGLATPLACVMFVSLMVVAIWTVHWKIGYFIFLPNGGWEYCAAIVVVATSIGILGPGEISLDATFGVSDSLGIFALPIGIIFAVCHLALTYRPKKTVSSS
jgi:putative oxidoreductase